jgi:hypothetical protein
MELKNEVDCVVLCSIVHQCYYYSTVTTKEITMNERITELAEQCYHQYSEHNIDLEKFAELIVQECCDLMQGFTFEEIATKVIKKNFGVE